MLYSSGGLIRRASLCSPLAWPCQINSTCECMRPYIGTGLLPSTGTPSQNRGSCYQMVKQTHRPTAHNSNPLSTLLSTCLSLVHYLSCLWCVQRRGESKGKKSNAEIMRISKKFLEGMFNCNHQDYPSSVALIPPPLSLPRLSAWCMEMKANSEHLEWQRV